MDSSLAHRHYRWVPTPSKFKNSSPLLALGGALKSGRKREGLSQEALAQLVKMDRSYLGAIERGENSVALLPLLKIATALNTSVASLMDEAGL